MTTTTKSPEGIEPKAPPSPRRPRNFQTIDGLLLIGSALSAMALVWLIFYQLTLLSGGFGYWLCTFVVFLLTYWGTEAQVHGRIVANDRVVSALITAGALALIAPLALIVGFLVKRGYHYLSWNFLTQDQKGVGPLSPQNQGGVGHAIVGTLEEVGIAALFGVPAAVLTAVYLNEVGGRLTRTVRTVVTAMSGLPSIVAGIFIYSLWVKGVSHGQFSGFAGALALAVMLLPSITRTTEEVLKVVPSGLREASQAMGAPDWRTTWSVVLPTARRGIVTAVLLGLARAVGETAPLIVTIFGNNVMNANPLHGPQEALPFFIWEGVRSSQARAISQGFTAGVVLVVLVLILFTAARILGSGALTRHRRYIQPEVREAELAFTGRGAVVERKAPWEGQPAARGDQEDEQT
ncbi:MAG TPA: phosphate ABC transporter permease PstA [Acidimicrobiales bacterium]|nr:phosphate ABC transporter permease PstA [Acidimicrobiales bacterium]